MQPRELCRSPGGLILTLREACAPPDRDGKEVTSIRGSWLAGTEVNVNCHYVALVQRMTLILIHPFPFQGK